VGGAGERGENTPFLHPPFSFSQTPTPLIALIFYSSQFSSAFKIQDGGYSVCSTKKSMPALQATLHADDLTLNFL